LVRGTASNLFFSTLENFSMKKTLIALAAVAVSSAAMAQVTISGSYGFGLEQSAATAKGLVQTNGGITFSAKEDLGNGMSVTATAAFDIDRERGDALAGADRGITLTTGFGQITMGNTRTSTLLAGIMGGSTVADIYNTRIFAAQVEGDAISFGTKAGPVTVGLSRFGYERADAAARTTSATNLNEIRVGYTDGPLSITGSALAHSGGSIAKRNEIVGSYDAGVAKVSLGWSDIDTDTESAVAVAVSVPMGATALQYSTASKGTAKFTTYGADYSFSKQTRLRAHYSIDDDNGTKVNGYRVQLVKAF